MGVRILHDAEDHMACIYDSVTETAFGPLFHGSEDGRFDAGQMADAFLDWLFDEGHPDARVIAAQDLARLQAAWLDTVDDPPKEARHG